MRGLYMISLLNINCLNMLLVFKTLYGVERTVQLHSWKEDRYTEQQRCDAGHAQVSDIEQSMESFALVPQE